MTDEGPVELLKIYIASSVKNVKEVVSWTTLLRSAGHEVFSFVEAGPPSVQEGRDFPELQHLTAIEFIRNQKVIEVCEANRHSINRADAVLLLWPAGNSAHSEAFLAKGRGKFVIAYREHWPAGEVDAVYYYLDGLFESRKAVLKALSNYQTDLSSAALSLASL